MTRIAHSIWLAKVRHNVLRLELTALHPPSPQPN
jgi:hypothetical protein